MEIITQIRYGTRILEFNVMDGLGKRTFGNVTTFGNETTSRIWENVDFRDSRIVQIQTKMS